MVIWCFVLQLFSMMSGTEMSSLTEKGKAIKRMSLDPVKNSQQMTFNQRFHNSELDVRHPPQQSQSSISNSHEQYNSEDLQKIFKAISRNQDSITVQDLYSLLQDEGYSDNLYSAVEMIALVDENRKGFVTKKDFLFFFSNKLYIDEEKIPALPQRMSENREWVKQIDNNWETYRQFMDKDYCVYFGEKLKDYRGENKRY